MANYSLDDFAGDGDAESSEPDESNEAPGGVSGVQSPEDGEHAESQSVHTPEPAKTTARFSGEGVACETCGETVSRLWTDDGQFVCRSCKEW